MNTIGTPTNFPGITNYRNTIPKLTFTQAQVLTMDKSWHVAPEGRRARIQR